MLLLTIFAAASLYFLLLWVLLDGLIADLKFRRATFVILAVLIMSPRLVSDGVMYVSILPNVALIGAGSSINALLSVPALGSYIAVGFLAYFIARKVIRTSPRLPSSRRSALRAPLVRISLTVAIILPIFLVGNRLTPDLDIPDCLTKQDIEEVYGSLIDGVLKLHTYDTADRVREMASLRDAFHKMESVIYVSELDSRMNAESRFLYKRGRGKPKNFGRTSIYCTSNGRRRETGLMRCKWYYSGTDRRDVLRYTRFDSRSGREVRVEISFDFEEFLREREARLENTEVECSV